MEAQQNHNVQQNLNSLPDQGVKNEAQKQKEEKEKENDEIEQKRNMNSKKKITYINKSSHKIQEKLKELSSKRKIVIVDQRQINLKIGDSSRTGECVDPQNENKILDRVPSLKKIKKELISEKQIKENKGEQSSCSMLKKVKFEEIICDDELEKQNEGDENEYIRRVNEYYKELDMEGWKTQQKESKKKSIMSYICGILKFPLRKRTKIEEKLIGLQQRNVSGENEQKKMLKYILKTLIAENASLKSEHWKKLGFITQQPLNQLQQSGILFLLQWVNFISAYQQQSIKFANFCIELNCSAYLFQQQLSYEFYNQLKKGRIKEKTWQQYQQQYNAITLMCMDELHTKSTTKPQNMKEQVLNSIKKWSGKSRQASKNLAKKNQK